MRARGRFGRRRVTAFPEPGSSIDERYELESIIGRGGGSVVFQASDTRLNRKVAIKVIAPGEMDQEGLERFRREAVSIARLSHPGIVTIYDFNEYNEHPYLVLELVKGTDLWELIYEREDESLLPLDASLAIARNILDALDYAHRQEIIHRDLKPENVMVIDDDYNIKVMDFGLAYIRGQKRITSDGVVAGSAYYLAPELATDTHRDHRCDLYALGIILYEMLTGRLPFYNENPLTVINQHVHDPPIPPSRLNPEISPALEAVVLKLMAKRPGDRFADARKARNALFQLDEVPVGSLAPFDDTPTPAELISRIEKVRPPGREEEWKRLWSSWQQVHVGALNARPVVVISGEGGSGKTQFVHRLLVDARLSGAITLTGQCYVGDSNLPYRPFTEMLRIYLREHPEEPIPPAVAADLARLVPEIAAAYPTEQQPSLGTEAERLRLFEHVTRFLIDISRRYPLILLLEDLHCADPSSLALLGYLARHTGQHQLLIVLTYRPSDLDRGHPLNDLLRDLAGYNLVERIALHRLTAENVQALAEAVFGSRINSGFGASLYRRSEGNLFFVKELLKSLVNDGHVTWDEDDDVWHYEALEDLELPESIRSIIDRLLSQIDGEAYEVLRSAALIGREFEFELLCAASPHDEDTLLELLEQARKTRLIHEKKGSRGAIWVFENTVIRQTILDSLNFRQQGRLHLKLAKVLETRFPDPSGDILETIARHYSLGARADEDVDRAIIYLLKAADWARSIFALQNALELYHHAIDLSEDDRSEDRDRRVLMLREKRGMVCQQLGDYKSAAEDLETVLEDVSVNEDAPRKRHVLLQLGQVYRREERFEEAITVLSSAVELSRTLDDERLVADALYYLGATYWSWREIAWAVTHHEEGYEIVRRLGLEDDVAMRVLHGFAEALMRRGEYSRALALAQESLQLAQRLDDMEYQAENLAVLGALELDWANYERAQAISGQAIDVASRANFRLHEILCLAELGWAKAASGNYQEALKILHEVLEIARDQFKGITMTMIWDYIGACYYELEAIQKAVENTGEARACAERHGISWAEPFTIAHWAIVQIRKGNLSVGTLLGEALDRAESRGDLIFVPHLYQALIMLELARRTPENAEEWCTKMLTLAKEIRQPELTAQAHCWHGRVYTALGKYSEATSKLERGIQLAASLQRPRLMWDLHLAYVELFMATQESDKADYHRERIRDIVRSILDQLTDPDLRQNLVSYLKDF